MGCEHLLETVMPAVNTALQSDIVAGVRGNDASAPLIVGWVGLRHESDVKRANGVAPRKNLVRRKTEGRAIPGWTADRATE